MTPFEIHSFASADSLAAASASAWLDDVAAVRLTGQRYCVALSGGRITEKLLPLIVQEVRRRGDSLEDVHFFWADERCVPPHDAQSNYRLARELLLDPLNIRAQQVHRVPGEQAPDPAARAAAADLCALSPLTPDGQPVLDLIFLGIGEDGHVASLFPGESEEVARNPAVYRGVLNSPKPPPERVTLGYGAIAAARKVWMLASGEGKERALRESLAVDGRTPFARVLQQREGTTIFTDLPDVWL